MDWRFATNYCIVQNYGLLVVETGLDYWSYSATKFRPHFSDLRTLRSELTYAILGGGYSRAMQGIIDEMRIFNGNCEVFFYKLRKMCLIFVDFTCFCAEIIVNCVKLYRR